MPRKRNHASKSKRRKATKKSSSEQDLSTQMAAAKLGDFGKSILNFFVGNSSSSNRKEPDIPSEIEKTAKDSEGFEECRRTAKDCEDLSESEKISNESKGLRQTLDSRTSLEEGRKSKGFSDTKKNVKDSSGECRKMCKEFDESKLIANDSTGFHETLKSRSDSNTSKALKDFSDAKKTLTDCKVLEECRTTSKDCEGSCESIKITKNDRVFQETLNYADECRVAKNSCVSNIIPKDLKGFDHTCQTLEHFDKLSESKTILNGPEGTLETSTLATESIKTDVKSRKDRENDGKRTKRCIDDNLKVPEDSEGFVTARSSMVFTDACSCAEEISPDLHQTSRASLSQDEARSWDNDGLGDKHEAAQNSKLHNEHPMEVPQATERADMLQTEPTLIKELQAEKLQIIESQLNDCQIKEPQIKVEEPQVEEPQIEEFQIEAPQIEEPLIEKPLGPQPQIMEPLVKQPQIETQVDDQDDSQQCNADNLEIVTTRHSFVVTDISSCAEEVSPSSQQISSQSRAASEARSCENDHCSSDTNEAEKPVIPPPPPPPPPPSVGTFDQRPSISAAFETALIEEFESLEDPDLLCFLKAQLKTKRNPRDRSSGLTLDHQPKIVIESHSSIETVKTPIEEDDCQAKLSITSLSSVSNPDEETEDLTAPESHSNGANLAENQCKQVVNNPVALSQIFKPSEKPEIMGLTSPEANLAKSDSGISEDKKLDDDDDYDDDDYDEPAKKEMSLDEALVVFSKKFGYMDIGADFFLQDGAQLHEDLRRQQREQQSYSSRRSSVDSSEEGSNPNLRDLKNELKEMEEKFRKAMIANACLDNEKSALTYQVELLKDQLEECEEQSTLVAKELREKSRELELLKRSHAETQRAVQLLQMQLDEQARLVAERGMILVGNEEEEQEEDAEVQEKRTRAIVSNETATILSGLGSGPLDVRIKRLADQRDDLMDTVRRLKLDLEEEKNQSQRVERTSPEEADWETKKVVDDYKFKLQKSEQDIITLQTTVARLESQVIRFQTAAETAERSEEELKTDRRKLQRENREAMSRIEELETANKHLETRLGKLKTAKSNLLKDL